MPSIHKPKKAASVSPMMVPTGCARRRPDLGTDVEVGPGTTNEGRALDVGPGIDESEVTLPDVSR